jgi:hypothetical protein
VTEEPGVMGNLPRSRPGRRSAKRAASGGGQKRAAEVKPAKPKATRAKGAAKPAAKASGAKASAAKTSAAKASGAKASGAGAKARAGGSTRATGSAKAKPTRARPGGPAATTPSAGLEQETAPRAAVREERVETSQGSDPITAALRLGMAVGDAGLKAVAKIVERLPRP